MVRLTNLADYAVIVMAHSAGHDGEARLSAASVSEATGLPLPTVAKVTGMLSRAGLILSHRGAGGGFTLARPAGDISIADIIEAVDGPIALTLCADHGGAQGDCERTATCAMRAPWQIINGRVRDALSALSLADLPQQTLVN
jgi:FeS assembly SUF system regulator